MRLSRSIPLPEPVIDIIPNRFVFSIARVPPETTPTAFCFTIDGDSTFDYEPFFSDFGPLSILQIHCFVVLSLNHISEHEQLVHFYSTNTPASVANAILLAASFRLVYLGLAANVALQPFLHLLPRLKPYRDASSFPASFDLPVASCIHALERAAKLGWYNPNTFDPPLWAELETVDHGDMNWLIPEKLLAFASPYSTNLVQGFQVCTPPDIVPIFKDLGIDTVIRLNNKTYDEELFKKEGFTHIELYFPDGTCPPDGILAQFLDIIEGGAVVAVHCKAGLGRTGTLAACHMIKNYGFSALEAIAWVRLCRPGSIIGPQQHYLTKYDQVLHPLPARARPSHCHQAKKPLLSIPSAIERKDTPRKGGCTGRPLMRIGGTEEGKLEVQAVGITPQVPQPRKLQRAQNSRRIPK
jgi:cell division cycle 14